MDSDTGLRENSQQLIFLGARNSLVVQRPGLGAPTPEPWASLPVEEPRTGKSLDPEIKGIKKKERVSKPQTNGKSKIKQTKTDTRRHTHTQETKTEPNKIKRKRTTRQTKEPKNEMKQV